MNLHNFNKSAVAPAEDSEWALIQNAVSQALEKCDHFRREEGKTLHQMFVSCAQNISRLLIEVEKFDPARLLAIRERIRKQIDEWVKSENFDANRFEQELVFYVEKLDINEEKVRLKSHIAYFLESLDKEDAGKKLGFIAQEMGREVNTIGSKANDAVIQRLVVEMKDEIEKIKEQLNNIL
jgi:uncharacterized protein (TIGR00255 family)